MARRRTKSAVKLAVPQPPSEASISIWQALNEPIAYPTQEFTKTFFPVAIFLFISIVAIPYFGKTTNFNFGSGFVAGVSTEISAASEATALEAPQWYYDLKSTASSLGEFYQETIAAPFGVAASEILDISEPIADASEFLQPGLSEVKQEWLYLMADPY